MKNLEHIQDFKQRKLGKQEEVDMAGRQGGVLKMAGWTGSVRLQVVFGVEKIDKEREKQEL